MRATQGALSHQDIMNLTWRQFETYMDAALYWVRQDSEKGRQENATDDLKVMREDSDALEAIESEREKASRILRKIKERHSGTIEGND